MKFDRNDSNRLQISLDSIKYQMDKLTTVISFPTWAKSHCYLMLLSSYKDISESWCGFMLKITFKENYHKI